MAIVTIEGSSMHVCQIGPTYNFFDGANECQCLHQRPKACGC